MPAFDIDSQSPGGSFEPQAADAWSMPLGRIAGIRLFISYSVFVALAVLAGLVAMVQNREGNGDLPAVAMTAVSIWGVGWIVQLIVQLALHFGTRAKSDSITIGLLGVETGSPLYRRHPWSAESNLMSAFFSLTALILFGIGCLVIHMLTRTENFSQWSAWASELAKPSFGLDAVKNCYLTAAWLFWIQAACQAYPMPRNLGRGAIASAIALFAADADDELQIKLLRRSLQLISIMTLLVAMASMTADRELFLPRWPILVMLSLYLWVSTNNLDLRDWITSVHIANADPISGHLGSSPRSDSLAEQLQELENTPPVNTPWVSQMIESVRMRKKRKRAIAVMRREREEANDAARLDQVLKIVSERGAQSLNSDDKALLQRVSESLRRDRESEEQP